MGERKRARERERGGREVCGREERDRQRENERERERTRENEREREKREKQRERERERERKRERERYIDIICISTCAREAFGGDLSCICTYVLCLVHV